MKDHPEFMREHRRLLKSIQKFRFMTSGHLRRYVDNTEKYLNDISK